MVKWIIFVNCIESNVYEEKEKEERGTLTGTKKCPQIQDSWISWNVIFVSGRRFVGGNDLWEENAWKEELRIRYIVRIF